MSDNVDSESQSRANYLVTTWRTVQKLDSDVWRRLRDDAPFRFARWLAAVTTVAADWHLNGNPKSAVAWLPVLAVVMLLLLPDASSIALGGFSWQTRHAVDQPRRDAQQLKRAQARSHSASA
jgi:cytochrome c-type biogenesis protein CcmH/NrfG